MTGEQWRQSVSSARKLYGLFERSDGRIKLLTLLVVSGLVAALAIVLVIPAFAGIGTDSEPGGVTPDPLNDWGGGAGACDFIGSDYQELHINNPMDDTTYTSADGVQVHLTVNADDTLVSYDFIDPSVAAYQVVVNGGQKSLLFDNWDDGLGAPLNSDGALHAPTKGNSKDNYYKLSHINICYGQASEISGLVYDDVNFDGSFDSGVDTPEEGVSITATGGGESYTQMSDSDGEYSFYLAPGTYTICEEARDGRVQTEPSDSASCSSQFEKFGYQVPLSSSSSSGNDFGTASEVCGQTLTDPADGVFAATVEIFVSGNSESGCVDKVGRLYEEGGILNLPLVGSGEAAGIATITKAFADPTDFEPLEYDHDLSGADFVDVPWCNLRSKSGTDGNQFDPYLDDDSMYPSLAGVTDDGTTESVACLVSVLENVEGTQVDVLLIQDDPRFR